MRVTEITFADLDGKTCILCAVEDFKFRMGDLTLEAVEDPDDGYRSCLSHLQVVDNIRPQFREKCTIRVVNDDILYFITDSEQIVLSVGTDPFDGYYPCFIFTFNPECLSCNYEPSSDITELISKVTEEN